MFFKIVKHSMCRGSIIFINQLSVLIAIPLLASRLDFFVFGQIAIGFILVQLSWVVCDFGVQYFSIENWSRAKTLRDQNRLISLLLTLRLCVAIVCLLIILFLILVSFLNFPMLFWICIIPSILMGGAYPLWFFQVNKIPQTMILPTLVSRLVYLFVIYL